MSSGRNDLPRGDLFAGDQDVGAIQHVMGVIHGQDGGVPEDDGPARCQIGASQGLGGGHSEPPAWR
jgi:hypothetical protein